jgi:lysozyme
MHQRRSVLAALGALAILVATASSSGGAGPAGRPPLKSGEAYGVDVASFQGQVTWSEVARAGISFAYIKATQGTTYVNPYFETDWGGAKAAGLAVGAYEFFSLCSSGAAQAQTFLATVGHDPAALSPAVDLELKGNCSNRPSPSAVAAQLAAYVSAIEKSTGQRAIFYIGLDFAARYKLRILRLHPLWLRRTKRPSAGSVVIWQPRTSFAVGGIVGLADLDIGRLSTLR